MEWNKPDENNIVDVPDYIMPLFNKIGMQLRMHTISGKNENKTVIDMTYVAEKFFKSQLDIKDEHIMELEEEVNVLKELLELPRNLPNI